MANLVGGQPGTIYTPDDFRLGKCPARGTLLETGNGKQYMLCEVAASQNLVHGHVVTVSGGFVVTVAAVAAGNTRGDQLAVVVTSASVTASASMFVWVQVYGRGFVFASTSILPNVALKIGTTAGVVTTAGAVTASVHTPGIVLTATSNVVPALTACILNYPRYGSSSNF
jgi:hypothetical protein